jgi:prevent-host-death family protein
MDSTAWAVEIARRVLGGVSREIGACGELATARGGVLSGVLVLPGWAPLDRSAAENMLSPEVAKMTTSGHNEAMKTVRIAELKARLSEYLRAVRRGETIVVLDRETRVAEIVPVRAATALRIRKPAAGAPAPNRVPLPKKPSTSTIDVVQVLLETRQSHR